MSAIPEPQDRGAFMSINSSTQQISGGIASIIAGLIVVQAPGGELQRYPLLGFMVAGSMAITIGMMYFINRYVMAKQQPSMQTETGVEGKQPAGSRP